MSDLTNAEWAGHYDNGPGSENFKRKVATKPANPLPAIKHLCDNIKAKDARIAELKKGYKQVCDYSKKNFVESAISERRVYVLEMALQGLRDCKNDSRMVAVINCALNDKSHLAEPPKKVATALKDIPELNAMNKVCCLCGQIK